MTPSAISVPRTWPAAVRPAVMGRGGGAGDGHRGPSSAFTVRGLGPVGAQSFRLMISCLGGLLVCLEPSFYVTESLQVVPFRVALPYVIDSPCRYGVIRSRVGAPWLSPHHAKEFAC